MRRLLLYTAAVCSLLLSAASIALWQRSGSLTELWLYDAGPGVQDDTPGEWVYGLVSIHCGLIVDRSFSSGFPGTSGRWWYQATQWMTITKMPPRFQADFHRGYQIVG